MSTSQKPRSGAGATAPAPAIPAARTQPSSPRDMRGDPIDRGFGAAIVVGSALGIVAMSLLIGVIVRIMAPEMELISVAGVAVWTGIWAGLFLGGTVKVGRWSAKNLH